MSLPSYDDGPFSTTFIRFWLDMSLQKWVVGFKETTVMGTSLICDYSEVNVE